jgi:hypothetical protein
MTTKMTDNQDFEHASARGPPYDRAPMATLLLMMLAAAPALHRARLPAGAGGRGRGRGGRDVPGLRLGHAWPRGGRARLVGGRHASPAPRADARRERRVPRPARGARCGEHTLAFALDRKLSARGAREARVESVAIEAVAEGEPGYEALAHAPSVHTRSTRSSRFSDVPLVAWVESHAAPEAGRELRYSIVFSNEAAARRSTG